MTGKNGSGKTSLLLEIEKFLKAINDKELSAVLKLYSQFIKKAEEKALSASSAEEKYEADQNVKQWTGYLQRYSDGVQVDLNQYDDLAEGYFEADAYSDELKNSLNRYEELCFRNDLTEDERAERAEIRIKFKNISTELSGVAKERFEDIERRRKAND